MRTIDLVLKSVSCLFFILQEPIYQSTEGTDLVPREAIEIDLQIFHINLPMWSKCHRINTDHCSWDRMHHFCDRLDIMDRSEDITCVSKSHEFRFLTKQRLEVLRSQFWIGRCRWCPPLDGEVLALG